MTRASDGLAADQRHIRWSGVHGGGGCLQAVVGHRRGQPGAGAAAHGGCHRELQTKVLEGFTITEKAPTFKT